MALTRFQFLLTKLAEEATEVAKEALKCQQFGFEDVKPTQHLSNKERLQDEIIDLRTVVGLIEDEFALFNSVDRLDESLKTVAKENKLARYYLKSQGLGYIEPKPHTPKEKVT